MTGKPDEDITSNMFEQRASRGMFVNGLIVLAFVAVAASVWPTETRQLERRVKDYLKVGFRGDADAAYAFLAPDSRQKVPVKVWWPANKARLANSELVEAQVDGAGKSASVTLVDTRTKAKRGTTWVKVGTSWYHDYDGK